MAVTATGRNDRVVNTFDDGFIVQYTCNVVGHNGDQWFTSFRDDGPIGRISKDGVLSKFYPPTKGKPQRLQVDEDGWRRVAQPRQIRGLPRAGDDGPRRGTDPTAC